MTRSNSAPADWDLTLERWTPPDRELAARLDWAKMPRHVAIIMDGNGRWARKRGLAARLHGHRAGTDAVRSSAETCAELGLRALSLYAFSTENWKRPKAEIEGLMRLLKEFLQSERPTLMRNNIRLAASGRIEQLPASVRETLDETIQLTSKNNGLTLNLALSYSGREELTEAARRIAQLAAEGRIMPDAITASTISEHLYHPELGDPDLLIRTSGEYRISNFMLWQIAYAEIHITPVLWPDFRRKDLLEALLNYQGRERRFGGVPQ